MPKKILVIQTAFIGDVVLATAIIEKLHTFYPDARLDFLGRAGTASVSDSISLLLRETSCTPSSKLCGMESVNKKLSGFLSNPIRFLANDKPVRKPVAA